VLKFYFSGDYDLLIKYIEKNWRNDEEVYFSISRTLAIFFGDFIIRLY